MKNALTFSTYINLKLNEYAESLENGVFFGQNVITGSRISGLGARMDSHKHMLSFNTPNSENSLFGMGFGLSIAGIPSIYLMKQHDFALLAIDHMVNTKRLLENYSNLAPFLVFMVVVDSGYEGPQSNLNNLDDFHSLSQAKVWLLNSKFAIDYVFESKRTNFEIFAISQKTLKSLVPEESPSLVLGGFTLSGNPSILEDSEPVLVNCGLTTESFESCVGLLVDSGIKFHVARQLEINIEENSLFIEKLAKPGRKFVFFDSSKSQNRVSKHLAYKLENLKANLLYLERHDTDEWRRVSHDQFQIDYQSVLRFIEKR